MYKTPLLTVLFHHVSLMIFTFVSLPLFVLMR